MTVGDFPINGKIVVVTGGGSGIGLAFVKLAVAHDAKVIIGDLRLTSDAEEFLKITKNVIYTKCDVANWADLHDLVIVSKKSFGDVPDVYIAAAGVFEPPWSNFWSDTETERYAMLDINTSHPIKLTRIAIRSLLSVSKPGVILLVSSIAGLQGNFAAALYSASKHALVGFTRGMDPLDDDESIKVVCVCPSVVATPLWHVVEGHRKQYNVDNIPNLSAEEVAEGIMKAVQEREYPGGTVAKVDTNGLSKVVFNETKESLKAVYGNLDQAAMIEMREKSKEPVREILKGEKGGEV